MAVPPSQDHLAVLSTWLQALADTAGRQAGRQVFIRCVMHHLVVSYGSNKLLHVGMWLIGFQSTAVSVQQSYVQTNLSTRTADHVACPRWHAAGGNGVSHDAAAEPAAEHAALPGASPCASLAGHSRV